MKLTKFVVLALGVLGVASFFLPLLHVKVDNYEGKASAFEVVRGVEQAKELTKDLRAKAGRDVATGVDNVAARVDDVVSSKRLNSEIDGLRKRADTAMYVVLLPFVPPILFLLFGILGLVKGSFGRGLGVGTLLFSLLGIGMWFLLYTAAKDQNVENSLGIGAYALGVSYAGAAVLGLLTLFKPDTGDNW